MQSCVTVNTANLQSGEGQVQVFTTEGPNKNYVEIRYIEASGSIFHRPEKLLQKLKEEAKKHGAHAVINVKFSYAVYIPYVSGTAVRYGP